MGSFAPIQYLILGICGCVWLVHWYIKGKSTVSTKIVRSVAVFALAIGILQLYNIFFGTGPVQLEAYVCREIAHGWDCDDHTQLLFLDTSFYFYTLLPEAFCLLTIGAVMLWADVKKKRRVVIGTIVAFAVVAIVQKYVHPSVFLHDNGGITWNAGDKPGPFAPAVATAPTAPPAAIAVTASPAAAPQRASETFQDNLDLSQLLCGYDLDPRNPAVAGLVSEGISNKYGQAVKLFVSQRLLQESAIFGRSNVFRLIKDQDRYFVENDTDYPSQCQFGPLHVWLSDPGNNPGTRWATPPLRDFPVYFVKSHDLPGQSYEDLPENGKQLVQEFCRQGLQVYEADEDSTSLTTGGSPAVTVCGR
jgi:hypothetical protein